MEKSLTRDVFTPTKPARIAFVERDSVNDKLVNSLTTPGKQIVVYGHSGTGKTTLLVNKLTQLYEHHISTRCMKGIKFEQLVLDAFDQLSAFYTQERQISIKTTSGIDLLATYKILQAKLTSSSNSEQGEKQNRILPPQLTPQTLGRFLGAQNACWVLEDFHKIDESEKDKLSQLMKVFMDLADDYPDLKIIALGAVDTARQVVDYDPEMRNRVAEIQVSLMTEDEIAAIIAKGEKALNIKFGSEIKRVIARHTNGLASVCHHICLNMCNAAGVTETVKGTTLELTRKHCEEAIRTYVEDASDSIKSVFDKALKNRRKTQYDNAALIIEAMSNLGESGAARTDIHRRITRTQPKYPETNLKYMLPKLCTNEYGGIIRFDSNSGRYSFSDPIYRAYAIALFQRGKTTNTTSSTNDFEVFLMSVISEKVPIGKEFRILISKKN
ncbi:AAA family ATPase [Ralstonia solanacearum species complex bacterium KE056]|uniref:AAA family ATPase n=1 Tax=Ralstonia solanacearum species complex bacterium KE056 TaxID=3119585 RepID=UPI002FC2C06E